MIVLDTHVWIGLINGNEKIVESGFLPIINKNMKQHEIYIPAICTWEISMLASKDRIILSDNTLDWIKEAVSAPGITLCPLTPEIAFESANLPDNFHGDPADRMIVATARILQASLLTFDKKILNYAKKGYVKYHKPKHMK